MRRAGEAMLIAAGALWAITLLLDVTGIGWSRASLLVATAVAAIVAWWKRPRTAIEPAPLSPIDLLTVALIAGYALVATAAAPWDFDYLVNFGLKARTFAEHGGIDWAFLRHPPAERAVHPGYPLLLPLLYADVAILGGGWTDRWLGLVHVAFGLALILVIRCEWRTNRHVAAAATLIVAPLALSPWVGTADGPLLAYLTAALLAIRRGSLTTGAILLGLAGCTKNEGLSLIVAVAIAMIVAGRRRELLRLWPALAIAMPWVVIRTVLGIGTDITSGSPLSRALARLADPSSVLGPLAANPIGKPWLWIGIALALVLHRGIVLARERFTLTAVLVQLAFYLGAYLVTPHDVAWHVQWSLARVVSHVAPILAVIAVAAILEAQKNGRLAPPDAASNSPAVTP
jgi:hypothetical protein